MSKLTDSYQTDKGKYVHSVFESIAKEYDLMNTVISFGRHKAWRNFTIKKMGVKPGQTSIDVCCGTADWAIQMARQVGDTGRVIGLDFSQNMLNIGRQKVQKNLLANIDLIEGDAMNIPYPDNSFDYATIGFALRNVPDIIRVLSEMRRVVKPGGQVVSLEVSKPPFAPYRKLFYFYFYNILPLIAKLIVNKYEQYSWLPESLTHFPNSKELAQIFEQVGLINVSTHLFAGGVAALHIGFKPFETK